MELNKYYFVLSLLLILPLTHLFFYQIKKLNIKKPSSLFGNFSNLTILMGLLVLL